MTIATNLLGKYTRHGSREVAHRIIVASILALFVCSGVQADTFELSDGRILEEAEIVKGTDEIIYVKVRQGSLLPIALDDIRRVTIALKGGDEITGLIVGFTQGEYEIIVGDRFLAIANGQVTREWTRPIPTQTKSPFEDDSTGRGGANVRSNESLRLRKAPM